MTLHGLLQVSGGESSGQAQRGHIQGIDPKVVVVQTFVIPRRTGAVIAVIVAITHESGVVIDALATAGGTCRRLLAALDHTVGAAAGGNFAHIGRNIGHHPVDEIDARQIVGDAAAGLIAVIEDTGHVVVHANQGEGPGAGRHLVPGQLWIAVGTEAHGLALARDTECEFAGYPLLFGKTLTAETHDGRS